MYKITFSDGTVLSGLGSNANNFISPNKLTREYFSGKLAHVKVEYVGDEPEYAELAGEFGRMKLDYLSDLEGGTWFVLRELGREELAKEQARADIDYLALMTGVEL